MIKPVIAALLLASPAAADPVTEWQDDPARLFEAEQIDLAALQWIARPVVVFADTPNDPRFAEQLKRLAKRPEDLVERDVIVITDTDPKAASPLREKLRPRGFMLVLIGKDGGVKLRKPFPWSVRELSRSIDKMPMRQQEMRGR